MFLDFQIIDQYPEVLTKVRSANFLNAEYVEPKGTSAAHEKGSEESFSSYSSHRFSSASFKSIIEKITFAKLLIHENDRRWRIFNYIISVHLATISSLWFSFVILLLPLGFRSLMSFNRITSFTLDIIYIFKMFVNSHLSFVDPESGVLVTDKSSIQRRYFCSFWGFWFDLITSFPFNLSVFFHNSRTYARLAYTNHMFRWFYLVMYYNKEESDLNLKLHLRWTYLIYTMLLTIQIGACLW